MSNSLDITVEVDRADGLKCPRCWKYFGIPELPQGICDTCAQVLLSASPEDFFGFGTIKEEDQAQFSCSYLHLQKQIREAYQQQSDKYRVAAA